MPDTTAERQALGDDEQWQVEEARSAVARWKDIHPDPLTAPGFERVLADHAATLLGFVDKLTEQWQAVKDDLGKRIDADAAVHAGMLADDDLAAGPFGGLLSANRSTLSKMNELDGTGSDELRRRAGEPSLADKLKRHLYATVTASPSEATTDA